jgi:hypothetical protein
VFPVLLVCFSTPADRQQQADHACFCFSLVMTSILS